MVCGACSTQGVENEEPPSLFIAVTCSTVNASANDLPLAERGQRPSIRIGRRTAAYFRTVVKRRDATKFVVISDMTSIRKLESLLVVYCLQCCR